MREAERFYASHVLPGRAFGELDHPDPASPLFRLLDAANVCHQVLDYWWEGNALVGVVEVLPTPKGEELRDYFLQGRQLGVSSRGWATLHDPGDGRGVLIQDNFELITCDPPGPRTELRGRRGGVARRGGAAAPGSRFDFVSDPSTVGAYLSPLTSRYKKLKPQADVYAYFEAARGPAPS